MQALARAPPSPALSGPARPRLVGAAGTRATLHSSLIPVGPTLALRGQRRPAVRRRGCCAGRARADTRANGEAGYAPGAPFYKVEAVLRPWRVKFVCRVLLEQGIRGVTVSDVRGFGAQGGSRERQAGSEFADDSLVCKSKIEVIVIADQVEDVVQAILTEARTGEIGDGKIFISPVSEVIRVRTGERGVDAERMEGGRKDILTSGPHIFASIDGGELL